MVLRLVRKNSVAPMDMKNAIISGYISGLVRKVTIFCWYVLLETEIWSSNWTYSRSSVALNENGDPGGDARTTPAPESRGDASKLLKWSTWSSFFSVLSVIMQPIMENTELADSE
ncbi:hypothetical protein OGAPHI_006314 [Ogataea philodendri]|uniref:Uncharacterized protein n=1 Tax=Ogataea philodendri TaxID=1378263 RepID=A0A9P8T0V1_9ASCO|nr:uncharacterized protein OGAPHI_006314 [Ogataea philodendri]KAH3662133.1 hypothetical protein OGAPHI_006314 [Ogataea philodendri]